VTSVLGLREGSLLLLFFPPVGGGRQHWSRAANQSCNQQQYSTDTAAITGAAALELELVIRNPETIQQKSLKSSDKLRKKRLSSGQPQLYKLL